jgi:hypothetical protein
MSVLDSPKEKSHDSSSPNDDDAEQRELSSEFNAATFAIKAAYWPAWLTTVASAILTRVRKQLWPSQDFIKSPMTWYIYSEHIDFSPAGSTFYTASLHIFQERLR